MDSKRVQRLVEMYKSVNDNRICKNALWNELAKEYEPIIKKLCSGIHKEHLEDFQQFIHLDILLKIDQYNPNIKCLFNSFLYWRLLSVRDRFYKTLKNIDDKQYSKIDWNLKEHEDNSGLIDLELDIDNILTSEEKLTYISLSNDRYRYDPSIDGIITKLMDYIHGNFATN